MSKNLFNIIEVDKFYWTRMYFYNYFVTLFKTLLRERLCLMQKRLTFYSMYKIREKACERRKF